MNRLFTFAWVSLAAFGGGLGTARAQVGEPIGSFGIKITHGANVIVNDTVTIGPANELSDLKATFQDGDPESHTQVGSIGLSQSPIILKVTTDNDPNYRVAHFYIDVPASLVDIYSPGPTSLFDPFNPATIDVEITNMQFAGTAMVTPEVGNSSTYLAAFMRDLGGAFYNLPSGQTNGFPGPFTTVQVPGVNFYDLNASPYLFTGTSDQPTASFAWRNLVNPGLFTTVNNGIQPIAPSVGGGYVFELGLSVAFTGSPVPEPSTLGLLASGMIPMIRRRRVR